jgi:hypothetical protein
VELDLIYCWDGLENISLIFQVFAMAGTDLCRWIVEKFLQILNTEVRDTYIPNFASRR